jgi:hypothetical protein
MLTLFLALSACTPAVDPDIEVDTETDVGADPDTDAAPATLLEAGRWSAAIVGIENSTCGESFGITITMAPAYSLKWTSDTRFILDDGSLAQPCDVGAGDAVTCETYVVPIAKDVDYEVVLTVPTRDFEVVSAREFTRIEVGEFSCEGDGCAASATTFGAPGWPCSLDIVERYTR